MDKFRAFNINIPCVQVKHIPELSYYNHHVYELTSTLDCYGLKIYIVERCDDDNLMTYTLTKNPTSKDFDDILFQWDTSWDERIRFDEDDD
jgi:hypothetical protein